MSSSGDYLSLQGGGFHAVTNGADDEIDVAMICSVSAICRSHVFTLTALAMSVGMSYLPSGFQSDSNYSNGAKTAPSDCNYCK